MKITAYKRRKRVFVVYYDTGVKNYLQCPECSWQGAVEETAKVSSDTAKEIECPRCQLKLGMVSPSLGSIGAVI